MKKLRLSYSLMETWERGDVKGTIDCYFHVDKKTTKQMEDGKRIHKDIGEYILRYNNLPDYMNFNYTFTIPEVEKEVIVPYNEMLDIKGVFDCLNLPDLFEFKTGVSNSLEWTRTRQIPLYFLIAELNGIREDTLEKAFLIRYNQYENKSDFSVVHNSKRLRDEARNFCDTVGPEIHSFFEKEGLL